MEWKDIINYEGFYMVSSDGQVKSLQRYVPHNGTMRLVKERILKQNTDKDGYKTVILQRLKDKKTVKIHRLVALHFICDSNLVVNHKDTNKSNNNLYNLEFTTVKDNNLHARNNVKFNLIKGKDHYRFKLTDEIKQEIKAMKKSRVPNKVIAEKFNIHEITIYKVLKS